MFKTIAVIFLGGGLGCVLRFLIGKGTLSFYSGSFPVATFIANIISCFILMAVLYFFHQKQISHTSTLYFFLITGFCGGLSTFSTFSFETAQLIKQGELTFALLNVGLSLVVGIGAMFFLYEKV